MPSDYLPYIIPIVIYSGDDNWTAKMSLYDMRYHDNDSKKTNLIIDDYSLQLKYFLIDLKHIFYDAYNDKNNFASLFFSLDTTKDSHIFSIAAEEILKKIYDPKYSDLKNVILLWLNRIVLKRHVDDEKILKMEYKEVSTMLRDRLEEIKIYSIQQNNPEFWNSVGADYQEQIDTYRAENEQLKAENKQLKAENKQLKAENEQLKDKIEQRKAENKQLKDKIEQRKAENKQLKDKIEQRKAKTEQLKAKIEQLKAENEQLKDKTEQRKAENKQLKDKLKMLEDMMLHLARNSGTTT